MDMADQKRKSTGRKKIEIKKVEKESNKQVTFSKRRQGLFKKASELCILCDVHASIIVFSGAHKLFSFGHPDTDSIVNSYVNGTREFERSKLGESSLIYEEYNKQYGEALKELEMEKKELVEVEKLARVSKRVDWWNEDIDNMSHDQLQQFMVSLYELRGKLYERDHQRMMELAMLKNY
ncbi:agamous-like MADS-box protein AGL61 [Vicia villosa]|uniref:agamous-like MADS-box protein AGL61 n=1 Tax=Vicia villosa TaxID=3911 RepID=UPI00273B0EF2|nr:agamous-like MADS-box protein AGL61 [Vicia villosa]